MHTPDSSSEEEQSQTQAINAHPELPTSANPTDDTDLPAQPASTSALTSSEEVGEADQQEEPINSTAILQGLVYPPPPDFYLQTQQVTQETPVDHPSRPPQAELPPAPYRPNPSDPQPGLRQTQPINPRPQQSIATKKMPRGWIPIIILAFVIGLCASGSLCGWALNAAVGNPIGLALNVVTDGLPTVTNYYDALQNKNYAQAYSWLAKPALTQDQFIEQEKAQDDQFGPVYRYTIGQPTPVTPDTADGSTPVIKEFRLKVDVSRGHKNYSETVTISKISGQWKIISISEG
ncbi:hypothetical protein [Tengunoibacter tsumagoiensis]|uniref:DUF4878 domain-containing protein n=1 Tax=Tengunoibacter tsumagoiensis TaxID=2014871 RepID=A0A401ZWG2_9CHLR|nr:hypothetical protein [Tengunoibacter tsumagoiensis]GCE11197.1 hypothetical protein KTT_10560 [Tengunoibacter tsumagoiensis]